MDAARSGARPLVQPAAQACCMSGPGWRPGGAINPGTDPSGVLTGSHGAPNKSGTDPVGVLTEAYNMADRRQRQRRLAALEGLSRPRVKGGTLLHIEDMAKHEKRGMVMGKRDGMAREEGMEEGRDGGRDGGRA